MATLLESAATWLGGQLQTAAGKVVTITQGGLVIEGVTGWVKATTDDVDQAEDIGTSFHRFDWGFLAADLPDGFEALPGDLISETETDLRYKVVPTRGRPAMVGEDGSGVLVTMHTIQVG